MRLLAASRSLFLIPPGTCDPRVCAWSELSRSSGFNCLQDAVELDARFGMNARGVGEGIRKWQFIWHQAQPLHARALRGMRAVDGCTPFKYLNYADKTGMFTNIWLARYRIVLA